MNCTKCRQPLRLDDSLAQLSPSAYDLIASSLAPPSRVGTAPSWSAPAARIGHTATGQHQAVLSNPLYHAATRKDLNPSESFVVLGDSVLHTAPTLSVSQGGASAGRGNGRPEQSQGGITPRLSQLQKLFNLLSSSTPIDHPLCTDCGEELVKLMQRELDERKQERDRLLVFESEVKKKRSTGTTAGDGGEKQTRESLQKDIAKLKKAEKQAQDALKELELEKAGLAAEQKALDDEEAELAKEEAAFWRLHNDYLTSLGEAQSELESLTSQHLAAQKELARLQKTNVYNDAFCIGHEAGFATINGLRLGRLPNATPPVEWPEINAALGQSLLLLSTVARRYKFAFESKRVSYKLVPLGSFSRIEKTEKLERTEDVKLSTYELFGSGDYMVGRLLQNRRLDKGMVAFLDCIRLLAEYAQEHHGVSLPHAIVKDRIGDVSVSMGFGNDDETWTKAMRHMLLDLKILLGRATT